jgi:hypothetical protein
MERGSLEIKPRWCDEAHIVPEAEVEIAIHEMLASRGRFRKQLMG